MLQSGIHSVIVAPNEIKTGYSNSLIYSHPLLELGKIKLRSSKQQLKNCVSSAQLLNTGLWRAKPPHPLANRTYTLNTTLNYTGI